MSGESKSDGSEATIAVKFTSSDKAAGRISISLQSTVGALKEAIRKQFDTQPKRLIFQGRILNKDDQTLAECKLKDGLTVVVQAAPARTPAVSPASSSTPSPAPSNPSPGVPTAAARAPLAGGQQRSTVPGMGAAGTHVVAAVSTIREQSPAVAQECFSTLIKVIDNIIAHPMEEKYRRIKRANAGFRRKVGSVPGGEACMRALGFQEVNATGEDPGSWLLTPTASAWDVLNAGRQEIQAALTQVTAASGASPRPAAAANGSGSSATPGFVGGLGVLPSPGAYNTGGGAMGRGGMPDMGMVQRMAQDPAVLQGMMNDPSVQAMMRSNPEMGRAMQSLVANPALMSQALNMMGNNPGLMQHAQRMMQDPSALDQAAQMMGLEGAMAAGMAAGMNSGPGMGAPSPSFPATPNPAAAAPPPPNPAPAQTPAVTASTSPPADGGNTSGGAAEEGTGEMTEDEMLADAIRRSTQDN